MTKSALLPTLIASLALTSCSSGDGSPVEGQYKQTIKITELDFPGMTGSVKAQTIKQMEQVAGGGTDGLFCMEGDDGGRQWKQASSQMASALGGKCTTIRDEGSATSIDLEMKCTGTAKGDLHVIMSGEANSQGYDSSMAFEMKDPANGETARLAMDLGAERVGDCPG